MKVHGLRQWYWGLRAISFIEHPVRSITKSSSLIKCLSEAVHVYTRMPTSVPAEALVRLGFYEVVQVCWRSYLCPTKIHGLRQWYWSLRAISLIVHPVRSITKSSSLIKCLSEAVNDYTRMPFATRKIVSRKIVVRKIAVRKIEFRFIAMDKK